MILKILNDYMGVCENCGSSAINNQNCISCGHFVQNDDDLKAVFLQRSNPNINLLNANICCPNCQHESDSWIEAYLGSPKAGVLNIGDKIDFENQANLKSKLDKLDNWSELKNSEFWIGGVGYCLNCNTQFATHIEIRLGRISKLEKLIVFDSEADQFLSKWGVL
jgi:hypothetical protein